MTDQPAIWIVSYCDKRFIPTVTAFSNEEAALRCAEAFRLCSEYKNVCVDEVPIYSSFQSETGVMSGVNNAYLDMVQKVINKCDHFGG